MNQIRLIYEILHSHFGHQGWWPVTPLGGCKGDKALAPIYGIKTKNEKQKLEIIFGAVLTQNTTWKNVEKAIIELNKRNLIDINKIIRISQSELAEIIKSSGYYNQKAKKLRNVADFLKKYPIAKLQEIKLQGVRNLLLGVNGIGPETADSIILYVLDKPIFVIDAYTKRIFNRLGYKEKTYEDLQKLFMNNLPGNHKLFNEYHALLVELGKNHCKKKPACEKCPINIACKKDLYRTASIN